MKHSLASIVVTFTLLVSMASASEGTGHKPSPADVVQMLKAGNERFVSGEATYPHQDIDRIKLAGTADQGNYAYATVITCSDSRVPVELIFDAGVMDIFVIRVAGNVCDTDEVGSLEYGIAHVHTPVLVVLGHTQCGAVTAVTKIKNGTQLRLERSIPPLVDNIGRAVDRAQHEHPDAGVQELIPAAIEENVWVGIEDLFMQSPITRELVEAGEVKVVGAIYDVGTGEVEWLPEAKARAILTKVEADPARAIEAYAAY